MALPFVILNHHAVRANDIAIVSDNARAPENPQSSLLTMNSPPLVRAATWPREQSRRRNISPPPRRSKEAEEEKVVSTEKGTAYGHELQTLKLIDVYKSHVNASQAEARACALGRPRATNAARILSEMLESTGTTID